MPARKRKNSSSKKSITTTTTTTTTNATPNKKSNTRRASNRRGPPSLSKDDIIVGGKYMIIGGEWSKQQTDDVNATYVAEILAIRETSNRTNGKDFYVHFEGLDKRLDEWIDIDRIVCEDENDEDGNSFQSPINQRSSNSRQSSYNKRARLDLSKVDQDDHSNNVSLKRSSVHSHGHHDPKTKVRNIHRVRFGDYVIESWYYSPYPGKYGENIDTLYICENTFKYMLNYETMQKHSKTCPRQPPGTKIYEDENKNVAAFEIVGSEHPTYCQNLCLFAKLFIEHKTLYYDVAPFKFYVLTEKDKDGYHPVAYYSKENDSNENYNLACILTFPPHQRKGYGRFLMSLSYEMSKKAGILGSPEKPLSDLGKLSYRSFWTYCILSFLRQQPVGYIIKLEDIVKSTGFKREDIISTIHHLGMLKEWKGQFVIHYTRSQIGKILEPYDRKKFDSSFCKPEFLIDDGGVGVGEGK